MKNWDKHMLIFSLILVTSLGNAFAQSTKKKTTRMSVEYTRTHDRSEVLVATLRIKEGRYIPLTDVLVQFYSINDTTEILLDKIRTDYNGEAIFLIEENSKIFKDTSGFMTFEVRYPGNSSAKNSKRKVSVKQSNLEISFFQKEEIKSIEVSAQEIGSDGQLIPIEEEDLRFYIKGTFSLLNFAEATTDKNGIAQVEFPVEMPGDTAGVLTIVVKLEEHKTFGTVESRGDMNWAVQLESVKEEHRGLGDTDAPLWMVYTLIILLSAVWFHYFYVIFLIVKIKLANRGY